MSKKRYQISPIELVQWAEPLFGMDKAAEGFSEEQISSFETAANIHFPTALREYYLACGQASLNYEEDNMFVPAREVEQDLHNVAFSYDYIKSELEWLEKNGQTGYEDQEQLRHLPVERWNEIVGNYLLIWCENQACWYAGIRVEDLHQSDPPVYYNDQDDMYHWAPFGDSVQSFILSTILEQLFYNMEQIEDPEAIQRTLKDNGVDFQRLQQPYPFPGGRFVHTCLDLDTNTLYVYGEQSQNHSAYLGIIQAE